MTPEDENEESAAETRTGSLHRGSLREHLNSVKLFANRVYPRPPCKAIGFSFADGAGPSNDACRKAYPEHDRNSLLRPNETTIMQTGAVDVSVPDGFEDVVATTEGELKDQVRLMAALKMFELGKISSGHAAQLAGRTRAEFLEACGRYRVSVFNYNPEEAADELRRDLDTLRNLPLSE